MSLIVLGTIPEDTCYPTVLQELLELFAEHLDAATGGGGSFKTLYIQSTQPEGVPEETMWFNPVDKSLWFYGRAPGDTVATWMQPKVPLNTLTGDQLQAGTITSRELSSEVRAQLSVVSAAASNAVLNFETFHGGGSAGANFFIMSDGTLRATGKSLYSYASVNRFKNGTGFVTAADSSVLPKRCGFTPPLGDTEKVLKVYTMQAATFAVTSLGNVYSTGLNLNGQLGVGDTTDRVVFQRIDPGLFNNDTVVELAIGTADGPAISCYALTGAGRVYSWGHNYYGQLGLGGVTTGNTNQPSTPTLVSGLGTDNAQIISANSGSTAGAPVKVAVYVRKTGGTVYGCGWNGDGNLGLGNTTSQSSFVQVDSANLTSVTQIAAAGDGDHITFYAVSTTGTTASNIRACGYNNKGQVGNGNNTSPQTTTQLALTLSDKLVTDLRAFATVGNFSVLSVLSDGTMRNWGSNANKQLGLGSGAGTTNVTSPATPTVQDTSSNILFAEKVRIGGSGGKISTAVMARIFTGFDPLVPRYHVMTAGSNQFGQLGLGNTTDTDTFTRVLIDTTAVDGVQFGASNSGPTNNLSALLIRLTNGIAMACGYDASGIGQLGCDATPASISVPSTVNF